jgi:proline iminopeptidase
MKIAGRVFLLLAALVVLIAVAALSYRVIWQHRIANAVKITSPNGIDEATFMEVNGAQEWITIRGENKDSGTMLSCCSTGLIP